MEEKIKDILRQCQGINHRAKMRQSIVNNYDIIYRALVDDGVSGFVAHTWTMLELARLHGSVKVKHIMECPASK